jgi:hypothetical protein
MEKRNWILKIYRLDRRCRAGERLVGTYPYDGRTEQSMQNEVGDLLGMYPKTKYRIEFHPATKTVKNLVTGEDVEIAYNTPYCCDPSTERYWSM